MGITQEENLLLETATREAQLLEIISDLENDSKVAKQAVERLEGENDRVNILVTDLSQQVEMLENQRKQYKKEIKEFKFRETRNLSDYSELEEENISLQKSLLQLKQNQVDFESMKLESKRLKEDVEELTAEVEELVKLKAIVEKNLDEALQSLQQEREQKHALKKELDQRINSESMFNLQSLANLGFGDLKLGSVKDSNSSDTPALARLAADFGSEKVESPSKSSSSQNIDVVGDLFSEVHVTEIRKLEQILEKTELEKSNLQLALDDSHGALERAKKEIAEQHEKITHMKGHISAMASLSSGVQLPTPDSPTEDNNAQQGDVHPDMTVLKNNLKQQEQRYNMALSQITNLQEEIQNLKQKLKDSEDKDEIEDLRDEVTKLRNNMLENEEARKNLEEDLKAMSQMAGESQSSLNATQDGLIKVAEDLAQVYHLVCEVNGETPNRVMLEHVQGKKFRRKDSPKEGGETSSDKESSASDREGSPVKEDPKGDPVACYKLIETINDQIKYLRRAVDHSVEISRQRQNMDSNTSEEVSELQEQVVKLKAMLSTKREQIATLRSVLKANKSTAEVALANLKQKYENEKRIVTDTMQKLRNELKALKEDAVSFASLRAMFAQRCDEYVTQLDELQRQLASAEEEKKTLNSLLRMAIQQKLALTQRLEDMECDRERRNMRSRGQRSSRGMPKVSFNQHNQGPAHYDEPYGRYPQQRYQPRRDY